MSMISRTVSVVIGQPFDDVYGFLADPRNYASWGPVAGADIHYLGGADWLADLPRGPQIIRFAAPNLDGVLDYTMFGPGEPPGLPISMRLVPIEGGCELHMIWRQRPGTDAARFEAELSGIASYFGRLKALLEAEPAP
jgi:hypothetical protein